MSTLLNLGMIASLRLLLLLPLILLSACTESSATFYLFGEANSCFSRGTSKDCQKFKAYDKVTIMVTAEKQAVSYVQKAYGLDESNTIFKTLEGCKVIDKDNFSCQGLSKASGKFLDTQVFEGKITSESFLLPSTSSTSPS